MSLTTTEPTLDDLDDQLGRLDAAHADLEAKRGRTENELRQLTEQWNEQAAWGNVDGDLATQRKGYEDSLTSVGEAITLNRKKYEQIAAQHREMVAAQQLAVDREVYVEQVAAFAQRPSAEALINRLLDTVYGALRATLAELRTLKADQECLDAESARHAGAPQPAALTHIPYDPGVLGHAHRNLWALVASFSSLPSEQRAAEIMAEHTRMRLWVMSHDNPDEPVPTWRDVIEDGSGPDPVTG
jgi:chromosome segregation ATPase